MGERASVLEVVAAFVDWAQGYYSKSEYQRCVAALKPVLELNGEVAADSFDQVALKAVRQSWIDRGLALKTIQDYQALIVRAWG